MGIVLVGFLVMGLALPVLPLRVHQDLGFGTFVVGLVTGSQFAASVLSRVWSGRYADARGAKRTVIAGLCAAATAGLIYLLSIAVESTPMASIVILLAGRALLGGAESFIITGAVAWGLAFAGPHRAGQVIAWMGMAMFAAMAAGAPLGTTLYAEGGFGGIALATIVIPLLTAILAARIPAASITASRKAQLSTVVSAVWLPGLGAALASVGFGAILAFSSLLSETCGWTPVWLSFSSYAVALVIARAMFGSLPDRFGGARIAAGFLIIEAAGLAVMWIAQTAFTAALGAAMTGFGYALVYPGLGAEAVRMAPPESRGTAMGAYTVSLDIALGIGSPALGALAGVSGLGSVFLASAVVTLCAFLATVPLMMRTS